MAWLVGALVGWISLLTAVVPSSLTALEVDVATVEPPTSEMKEPWTCGSTCYYVQCIHAVLHLPYCLSNFWFTCCVAVLHFGPGQSFPFSSLSFVNSKHFERDTFDAGGTQSDARLSHESFKLVAFGTVGSRTTKANRLDQR